MCTYCSMDDEAAGIIEAWADRGCPYSKLTILSRDSARTHPNTFVFFFENAVTVRGASKTVKVDVHYDGNKIEPGRNRVAIGGLWMTGINGAMKPQQHGKQLLRSLNSYTPGHSPKITDGLYGRR